MEQYKKGSYEILENRQIASAVFQMRLSGDTQWLTAPGQFVNIQIEGFFLRRPISVCSWKVGEMTLIYKVVGKGTDAMAKMAPGEKLDLLTGLGNGFNTAKATGKIALVGGGVGVPPLYGLAKALKAEGKEVVAVLGFNSRDDVFYKAEFEALGVPVTVTTVDGSAGVKGFVTTALAEMEYDYYCACGPMAMLAAVHKTGKPGQLSFEERMGCGFGACMGCSCQTIAGTKRICVEGPVMDAAEVVL